MLALLKSFRRGKTLNLRSRKTALIVMDMQRYFTSSRSHAYVPACGAIIAKIKCLALAFRKNNLPIVITRHLNTKQNAGALGRWWKDIIMNDGNFDRIDGRLKDIKATVVKKSQYDAFYKTPLDRFLKAKKVKQVLICGVLTHLCCETTARSAFVKNYDVLFAIDGTATYSESFHFASLLNLAHGFAVPVLTEEVIRNLDAGRN